MYGNTIYIFSIHPKGILYIGFGNQKNSQFKGKVRWWPWELGSTTSFSCFRKPYTITPLYTLTGWRGNLVVKHWNINLEVWGSVPDLIRTFPDTLCVSHPTRGELVWNPEVTSGVLVLYTGHIKEPSRSTGRRARDLYPDLLVSESFSLMVNTIYA